MREDIYDLAVIELLIVAAGAIEGSFAWDHVVARLLSPDGDRAKDDAPDAPIPVASSEDEADGNAEERSRAEEMAIVPVQPAEPAGEIVAADRFSAMSHEALVVLARDQSLALANARSPARSKQLLHQARKNNRRLRTAVQTLKRKLAEQSSANMKRGRSGRYFTTMGGLSLAIRRSASNVAAAGVSIMSTVDVSDRILSKSSTQLLYD